MSELPGVGGAPDCPEVEGVGKGVGFPRENCLVREAPGCSEWVGMENGCKDAVEDLRRLVVSDCKTGNDKRDSIVSDRSYRQRIQIKPKKMKDPVSVFTEILLSISLQGVYFSGT